MTLGRAGAQWCQFSLASAVFMPEIEMTPEIRKLQVQLAAALRAAAHYGLHEGVCNHFSAVVPGEENRFLINPQGLLWDEIEPEDIVIVDGQGRRIAGRHEVEPTAFFIHSWIHRLVPKARAVMHTHMPYATALALLEGQAGHLQWCSQNALRFYGRVAYDDRYNGLALDDSEGERIGRALQSARVVFLPNHGVIVCGASIAWAFDDLYYLERACMHQVIAQSTGGPLRQVPDDIARHTALQMDGERQQSDMHLRALMRKFGFDPAF